MLKQAWRHFITLLDSATVWEVLNTVTPPLLDFTSRLKTENIITINTSLQWFIKEFDYKTISEQILCLNAL